MLLKKLLLYIYFFIPFCTDAQNVSINNDLSLPDSSALLDIKSDKKGLLIPRMQQAMRLVSIHQLPGYWYTRLTELSLARLNRME